MFNFTAEITVYKLLNVFSYVNRAARTKRGVKHKVWGPESSLEKSCLLDSFDRYEGGTNFGTFNDICLLFTAFPPGKDLPHISHSYHNKVVFQFF